MHFSQTIIVKVFFVMKFNTLRLNCITTPVQNTAGKSTFIAPYIFDRTEYQVLQEEDSTVKEGERFIHYIALLQLSGNVHRFLKCVVKRRDSNLPVNTFLSYSFSGYWNVCERTSLGRSYLLLGF